MKDLLFVRMVNAAQNFSLKNNFEFIAFDDITAEHIEEMQETPESLEIWAAIKVPYTGELPDSYKVLNLMIGDWVESNLEKLTQTLHDELKKHFTANYPESDASALDQMEDTAVWLDQLDYMPDVDEDKKTMQIEIELVLNAESNEE